MNKFTFTAAIDEVMPRKTFQAYNSVYDYTPFVVRPADPETGSIDPNNIIAVSAWSHLQEEVKYLQPGTMVQLTVKLSSERNRKDPSVFFHKVNLDSIRTI